MHLSEFLGRVNGLSLVAQPVREDKRKHKSLGKQSSESQSEICLALRAARATAKEKHCEWLVRRDPV